MKNRLQAKTTNIPYDNIKIIVGFKDGGKMRQGKKEKFLKNSNNNDV